MKVLFQFLFVFWAVTSAGCGTSQALRTRTNPVVGAPSGASAHQIKVGVAMYRQPGVAVPIPIQGATLRSIVADAKDMVSQGGLIGDAFALNDVSTFAKIAGLSEDDIRSALTQAELSGEVFAGEEVVVLQRHNMLIFIPGIMVLDTAAGSVRVMPGDFVATVPLALIADLGDPQSTQEPDSTDTSALSTRVSVTLGGDYFEEMNVGLNSGKTVGNVLDFDSWDDQSMGIVDPLPRFDLNQLHPNAIVLSRPSSDGIVRLAILPPLVTLDKDQNLDQADLDNNQTSNTSIGKKRELQNDFGKGINRAQFLDVKLRDGDRLTLTRLERIPLIAAGLASPVTPRTVVEAAPIVNSRKGRTGLFGFARHR